MNKRHVYFASGVRSGRALIKIGVSRDVATRLATLAPLVDGDLTLLGCIPEAGQETESRLHQRFGKHRVRGREWYRDNEEIRSFVEKHCATEMPPPIASKTTIVPRGINRNEIDIYVTPTEKRAIRAIAALRDTDESNLLRTMLIDEVVVEFERIRGEASPTPAP